MTDFARVQQIRAWAQDAAADDPEGEVCLPGSWMVELLDERERMQDSLAEIGTGSCAYLFHEEAGDECPGDVCEARRGQGMLPPRMLVEGRVL